VLTVVCVQVNEFDRSRLQYLAFTARGCFAPLCAFLGGVVAQEALKALTGKFTPLNQWVRNARLVPFAVDLCPSKVTLMYHQYGLDMYKYKYIYIYIYI